MVSRSIIFADPNTLKYKNKLNGEYSYEWEIITLEERDSVGQSTNTKGNHHEH